MVGLGRFELPTSRLSGVRSNQLSYRPPFRTNLPTNTARTAAGEPRDVKPSGARAPKPCRRRKRRFPANGARERKGCAGGGAWCCKVSWNFPVRENACFLRKEVIQPQVPLRLPCYDFTPVADLTVVGCLLTVGAPPSGKTNSHGVTGGVYKARERIHRGMLIRDY